PGLVPLPAGIRRGNEPVVSAALAALAALAVLLAGAAAWLWLGGGNAGGHRLPMPPGHPGSLPHDAFARRPARRTLRRERTDHAADTEEYAKFLRQLAALLRAGTGPAAAFGLLAELWARGSTRTAIDLYSGAS